MFETKCMSRRCEGSLNVTLSTATVRRLLDVTLVRKQRPTDSLCETTQTDHRVHINDIITPKRRESIYHLS